MIGLTVLEPGTTRAIGPVVYYTNGLKSVACFRPKEWLYYEIKKPGEIAVIFTGLKINYNSKFNFQWTASDILSV
ncbi:MAG: hypothetical protein M9933_00625 [Chitinophagaceae bacterium]|nr:hypothetical protein [Chitinophagaceae bacterium]